MKKEFVMLLILVLSGLVVAGSSEIVANFNVGGVEAGRDYIPALSFWDVYSAYIIGLIIVLIVVAIYLKNRSSPVKGVKRKRRVKRKK